MAGNRQRLNQTITANIPAIHGDKFRPNDYIVDKLYFQGSIGDIYEMISNPPCIISGMTVTQGAGSTIDIAAGLILVKVVENDEVNLHDYDGTVIGSGATPSTPGERYILLNYPGESGITVAAPTTDGVTKHYVKLSIEESQVLQRGKAASPATTYDFLVEETAAITIDTTPPTADEFKLASFTAVPGPTFTISGGADREEDAVLTPFNDSLRLTGNTLSIEGTTYTLGVSLANLSADRTYSLPDRDHQIGGVEDWATGNVYYENEVVQDSGLYYRCTATGDGQTATGSFATDLGNSWWELASTEVIDTLVSSSTTAALSANQGRILKELIDANVPTGYIYGLELEYATAGSITVKSGVAKDDTDVMALSLASDITKNSLAASGTWTAGTGNSGIESGFTSGSGDDCHVFVIGDSTGTNPTDVLVSNSYSSPTLPSGYDKKRWIGALVFSGANTLPDFLFYSDGSLAYRTPIVDFSGSASAGWQTATLTVPSGLKYDVRLSYSFGGNDNYYFGNSDEVDSTNRFIAGPNTGDTHRGIFDYRSNSSSQIRYYASSGGNSVNIVTLGYRSTR